MTIAIVTIIGVILIFLYGKFAGIIICKVNNAEFCSSSLNMEWYKNPEGNDMINYWVIKSRNAFKIAGWGKHARIIVSKRANEYFLHPSRHALLLHELGHLIYQYTYRRTIYIIVQFIIIYPILASFVGWWQVLLAALIFKIITFIFSTSVSLDMRNNELLADLYAAKKMKEAKNLPALIRAYMELPNLRESDEHPSINDRIKSMYEGTKDIN